MLDTARPPQGLLLQGPAGIGKRTLAIRIAGAILCHGSDSGSVPCGACRSCRLFRAGSHPDYRCIEPAEGETGIAIGAVRALIEQFTLAAERARVALIAPAEAMNQSAANAFLKTLEEPAGTAVFILASDAPGRLPATIRSRCRKIALRVPSPAEALAWLETRVEPETARRLLALAGGAPLAALDIARGDGGSSLDELHSRTAALLEGTTDPLGVADRWRKTGDRELVMSTLFALLAATARRGATDPDRLYAAVDDVVATRRRWLEVPGLNEQLVYEDLALRCAGAAS